MGIIKNLIDKRKQVKKDKYTHFAVKDLKVFVRAYKKDESISVLKESLQNKDYTIIGYSNDEGTKIKDISTGVIFDYDNKKETCKLGEKEYDAVTLKKYLNGARMIQNTNGTIQLIFNKLYYREDGVDYYCHTPEVRGIFGQDNSIISVFDVKRAVKYLNNLSANSISKELKYREEENQASEVRKNYNKNF